MLKVTIAFLFGTFLFLLVPHASVAQQPLIDEAEPEDSSPKEDDTAQDGSTLPPVEAEKQSEQQSQETTEPLDEQTASESDQPKTIAAQDVQIVSEPEPTAQQRAQFRRALPHIKRAEALFVNEDYEASLEEYEQAYEILEGHPKQYLTLYNIGLCNERLFRYNRALQYNRRYLKEGGDDCPNREQVQKVINALDHLLAKLQISVNVGAEVWIDDVLVGQAPSDILVAGGRHTVEVRARGYKPEKQEIRVPAQGLRKLSFELLSDAGINPGFFWTTSMLTAVALGMGTYFGIEVILSDAEGGKYDDRTATRKTKSEIDKLELKSDVSFIVAGVLGVSSIILYLLTDWRDKEKRSSEQPAEPKVKVISHLSPDRLSLGLNGTM